MTLSVRALTIAYGGGPVVGPVDLDVDAGAWVSLIGPNGAGKTSLLHAVAGLVAHSGTVLVNGEPLDGLRPMARAQRVALVPQKPTIPVELTVAEYVLLGRTPHIPPFGVEGERDHAVVADVLARLSLLPFASRPLGRLSGGELQRVLLARALAQQAPVLLLDEPTTALDLGHQQRVLELVDELRHEYQVTVLMTMHDLTLAGAYADSLVLLVAGRAMATGTPQEVLDEATLAACYGASVHVVEVAGGIRAVVAVRPGDRAPSPAGGVPTT